MVRPAQFDDLAEWTRLRVALWPNCAADMHALEMRAQLEAKESAVFVHERATGTLGGFIEISVRDRVDGSFEPRVAYIEGWFVDADLRSQGIGRRLVERAEQWARERGFAEIGSDAEIENTGSIRAHHALGFRETFRLVHFLKSLSALALLIALGCKPAIEISQDLTFHKNVAPIVFEKCSTCHRPGQAAPFSLLTYADVFEHREQIREVTAQRLMPPWLAERGHGDFKNDRSLTDVQLAMLQKWLAEGAREGNPKDAPPAPRFDADWQLGAPDFVVSMSKAYALAADSPDIYHNVILAVTLPRKRFVRAVEFRPGNAKVVHHASLYFDSTGQSRRLGSSNQPPSFDGMTLPESAAMVAGQLLGWEPGKRAETNAPGLSWALEKKSDLVLQLHLHSSGKPEEVLSSVGFYFTDDAPTNTPFLLRLPEWRIDIPAGVSNYVVENSYTLPIDVDLLRISPHAHYLAKEMRGYALLPDGSEKSLLLIRDWNFNWQGDYTCKEPVFLPRGTKVGMRFTYDNSEANPRNPNRPPRRVRYGPQTTDEMAQLTLQVLPRRVEDRGTLAGDHFKKMTRDAMAYNESLIQENPTNAVAHARLGQAHLAMGNLQEAYQRLVSAIKLNPRDDKAHYDLGSVFLAADQIDKAKTEFQIVLRINPDDYQAHGNLGGIFARQKEFDLAERHFQSALEINPDDLVARQALAEIRAARGAQ